MRYKSRRATAIELLSREPLAMGLLSLYVSAIVITSKTNGDITVGCPLMGKWSECKYVQVKKQTRAG